MRPGNLHQIGGHWINHRDLQTEMSCSNKQQRAEFVETESCDLISEPVSLCPTIDLRRLPQDKSRLFAAEHFKRANAIHIDPRARIRNLNFSVGVGTNLVRNDGALVR